MRQIISSLMYVCVRFVKNHSDSLVITLFKSVTFQAKTELIGECDPTFSPFPEKRTIREGTF